MRDHKDRLEEALVERDKVMIRQEQHEKEIDFLTISFQEEINRHMQSAQVLNPS